MTAGADGVPLVSVLIPTYRRARFLQEAIDSVLTQTFQDFEVIVVEDGSYEAAEVVERYGTQVRYVWQPNQGVSVARNTGARLARGEWLSFLDDDDLWLPEKLERELLYVKRCPDAGLIHTAYYIVTDGIRRLPTHTSRGIPIPTGWVSEPLFLTNFIMTSSVLVRAKHFRDIGGFDAQFVRCEDYHLWLRLSLQCAFGYVRDPLVIRRLYGERLSDTLHTKLTSIDILERFLHDNTGIYTRLGRATVRRRISLLHLHYAFRFFWTDSFAEARRHFLAAWRWNPMLVNALAYAVVCATGRRGVKLARVLKRMCFPRSRPK